MGVTARDTRRSISKGEINTFFRCDLGHAFVVFAAQPAQIFVSVALHLIKALCIEGVGHCFHVDFGREFLPGIYSLKLCAWCYFLHLQLVRGLKSEVRLESFISCLKSTDKRLLTFRRTSTLRLEIYYAHFLPCTSEEQKLHRLGEHTELSRSKKNHKVDRLIRQQASF